jgi:hypothetical protein
MEIVYHYIHPGEGYHEVGKVVQLSEYVIKDQVEELHPV